MDGALRHKQRKDLEPRIFRWLRKLTICTASHFLRVTDNTIKTTTPLQHRNEVVAVAVEGHIYT